MIRVLITDDSPLARELLKAVFDQDDEIRVIGEAVNGLEALEKTILLEPDLVTMDIHMPVMDGIEAIRQIMSAHPVPILVITSSSDADTAYTAISKGALEVLPKPDVYSGYSKDILNKIKLLSKVKVISHIIAFQALKLTGKLSTELRREYPDKSDKLVAIASSTGGPRVLSLLLSALPEDFPYPIVIAQHISDDFVSGMAHWLNDISKLTVRIAEEGEIPLRGTVYLCLPEKHTKINSGKRIAFKNRGQGDIYFPSCNLLLSSAADVYGANSIGIILTGMGDDGVIGMKKIKEAGGLTIDLDEKTYVVFGMPKVAIESGCIDKVLPIQDISKAMMGLIRSR